MTVNKALYTPNNGADVGTWDQPMNGNFNIIDASLGTTAYLNQTSAGAYPLTSTVSGSGYNLIVQYQCAMFNISGTLAGNVVYQIPINIGGEWTFNATGLNLNGFTCTFTSATGGGTSVSIESGSKGAFFCDGTNVISTVVPGNLNGAIFLSASTTLTSAQAGSFLELTGASTFSYAFPAPTNLGGSTYVVWNNASMSQTVTTPSGVFKGPSGSGTSSMSLGTNTMTTFISDGTNWIAK